MVQDVGGVFNINGLTQAVSVLPECGPSVEKDDTTSLLCIPYESQTVHIYKQQVMRLATTPHTNTHTQKVYQGQ